MPQKHEMCDLQQIIIQSAVPAVIFKLIFYFLGGFFDGPTNKTFRITIKTEIIDMVDCIVEGNQSVVCRSIKEST